MRDQAGIAEQATVGVRHEQFDSIHWKPIWRLEKREGDWTGEQIAAGEAPEPYEVLEGEGNLLMTLGALRIWNAVTGATPVFLTNALARLGVGDSSTAASAAQTDLQATLAATKTITAASNATPISVTATAHGYTTGDTITVTGVAGNTAANGTWVIIVVDANTFTLTGSVGNGAYTSGGTAAKGNRFRRPMDASFPKVGTGGGLATDNLAQFAATFGTLEANWVWNEWAIFDGALTTSVMFNRAVASLGTKTTGSWTLTVTLTLT